MDLLDILEMLNRKERYYCVNNIIGEVKKITNGFRTQVQQRINVKIPSRKKMFIGIDYHLDWIFASAYLYYNITGIGSMNTQRLKQHLTTQNTCFDRTFNNTIPIITGTQLDADIIIAYKDKIINNNGMNNSIYRLILIEAKYDTSWYKSQIDNKISRLTDLSNYLNNCKRSNRKLPIILHYVFYTHKNIPSHITSINFPSFALTNNQLNIIRFGSPGIKMKPQRCTISPQNKIVKNKNGGYWHLH